jgi:hypothetical protein
MPQVNEAGPILGPATEQGLDDILAKLSADPATQTTLAAILAKIIAAPATEQGLDDILAKISADPATQTTLAAILTTLGSTSGAAVITDANGTAQQYLRGLVALYLAGLKAGEAHVGAVGGHTFTRTATVTRPNDTPGAYHVLDEINTTTNPATAGIIEFTNMARVNGGSGTILFALKRTNNVAANSQIRLHLYDSEPAAVCGDHTQFAKLWASRAKQIGIIDFPAPQIEGTGSDMVESQVPMVNMPFTCASATVGKEKSLFGRAEVRIAGTGAPTASQVIEFELTGYQD